jgi:hypothetical protein
VSVFALLVVAGTATRLFLDAPRDGTGRTAAEADAVEPPADEHGAKKADDAAVLDSIASKSVRDTLVDRREPREGPTLTFVEAETNHPLADAAVWMFLRDEVDDELWKALQRFDGDLEPSVYEHGHPLELDALATVKIEGNDSEAWIVADAGDRHLRRTIALDTAARRILRLVRRESLKVITADPNGRRQREVPVSLQSLRLGTPWHPPSRLLVRRVTDHDGEAVVEQGSEILDAYLDDDGLSTDRVVVAALAFPCRDPSPRLVDPRRGCAEPVILVTPPRSTLKLRAVDDQGLALDADVTVDVETVESNPSIPVVHDWTSLIRRRSTSDVAVEANVRLRLQAWSVDGWYAAAPTIELSAPAAESRGVELVLVRRDAPIPPGCFLAVGQVLAPDGSPLRSSSLSWQLDAGDLPVARSLATTTTDGDGRIRLPIPRGGTWEDFDGSSQPAEHRLVVFDEIETPPSRGARLRGIAKFCDPRPGSDAMLGPIRLEEIPVLVAGRVVDRDGLGIADVRVEVREDGLREPRAWELRTGDDGRFWIRDTTRARMLELWPSKEHWYREDAFWPETDVRRWISVAVSAADVECVLRRKGCVRGSILVDPGISRTGLGLGVLPKPAPDLRTRLDPDGRFFLEGAPSRRSVTVESVTGAAEPIRQIDQVVLREGEETRDPRLDPIDLRGDLRQIEIEVRSSIDDAPIRDVAVFLTRTRAMKRAPRGTDPFGRAILTTPTFDSALALGHPAWMIELRSFDRSFLDVQLSPAATVRVKVEGPMERILAAGTISPALRLERADRGRIVKDVWDQLPRAPPKKIDTMTYEFRATAFGAYELSWERSGERWPVRSSRVIVRALRVDLVEQFTEEEAARLQR